MTLSFSWATNANYSAGPDISTPTKVDPASTANGFINGTIAAAQHINFLFDAVGDQIIKAVDGVDGGTYTLGSALRFQGADVEIAADLEVLSSGEINIQSGGHIDLESGGFVDILSGGDINVQSGGDINVLSGGELSIGSGGVLSILSGGDIDVASGGDINLASGAEINVNSGGAVVLGSGGAVTVGGGGTIDVSGDINIASGGDLNVASGGDIVVAAGGLVTIEDQNDLLINSNAVSARLSMVPAWIESAGGAVTWDRSASSPGGALIQTQVDATAQYLAMFPIVLPPGDDIVGVTVVVHGTVGSAGAHADVPGLTPKVDVISVDSAGAQSTIASAASPNDGSDQSANQAAYDANHTLTWIPASTLTVSGFNVYYVLVQGEAGSDSQANSLGIRSITVTATARSFRGTGTFNILP